MTALFVVLRTCSAGAGLILLLGAMWFGPISLAFIADTVLAAALIIAGVWPDQRLQTYPQWVRGFVLVAAGLLALAAQIAFRATSSTGFASAPVDSWIVNALLIAMFAWRVLVLRRRALSVGKREGAF